MTIIGARIRELRNKHEHSQADLAKLVCVSRSTISMVERGERDPDTSLLEAIADLYNVDMNYLWGQQSEMNVHKLVTDEEFRLILAYRAASAETREIIRRIVER